MGKKEVVLVVIQLIILLVAAWFIYDVQKIDSLDKLKLLAGQKTIFSIEDGLLGPEGGPMHRHLVVGVPVSLCAGVCTDEDGNIAVMTKIPYPPSGYIICREDIWTGGGCAIEGFCAERWEDTRPHYDIITLDNVGKFLVGCSPPTSSNPCENVVDGDTAPGCNDICEICISESCVAPTPGYFGYCWDRSDGKGVDVCETRGKEMVPVPNECADDKNIIKKTCNEDSWTVKDVRESCEKSIKAGVCEPEGDFVANPRPPNEPMVVATCEEPECGVRADGTHKVGFGKCSGNECCRNNRCVSATGEDDYCRHYPSGSSMSECILMGSATTCNSRDVCISLC